MKLIPGSWGIKILPGSLDSYWIVENRKYRSSVYWLTFIPNRCILLSNLLLFPAKQMNILLFILLCRQREKTQTTGKKQLQVLEGHGKKFIPKNNLIMSSLMKALQNFIKRNRIPPTCSTGVRRLPFL